jgi:hypothetical protein
MLSVTPITTKMNPQSNMLAFFIDPLPAALNGAVQSASPVKSGAKGTCFLYQ